MKKRESGEEAQKKRKKKSKREGFRVTAWERDRAYFLDGTERFSSEDIQGEGVFLEGRRTACQRGVGIKKHSNLRRKGFRKGRGENREMREGNRVRSGRKLV